MGNVPWEAFGNYLGFDVCYPGQSTPGEVPTRATFLSDISR